MIILTSFTNYTRDKIFPFVSSLNSSGFSGRKIVVYYNPVDSIVQFLKEYGWEVLTYPSLKYYINFQRRLDFIKVIDDLNLENEIICCTDIRDVYFAKNPSKIPSTFFLGYDDNVTIENSGWNSESIKYRHPEHFNYIKDFLPFNAGVMITKGSLMKNFFLDYCEIIFSKNYSDITTPCSGVDQSTFNILAYTKYKNFISKNLDKYVLHMANMDEVENTYLSGYYIYHQYERNKKHHKYVVSLNKKSYI